jgi:hypothetical protein
MKLIWLVKATTMKKTWTMMRNLYIKGVFLNRYIQEEVYVEQPPDFESLNFSNHVLNL